MYVLVKLDLVMIQNELYFIIYQFIVLLEYCSFGLIFISYFLLIILCFWLGLENNLLLDSSIVYILLCWYYFYVFRCQLLYNFEIDILVVVMNGI